MGLAGLLGGAAGFAFGGPAGAAIGYGLGNSIGGGGGGASAPTANPSGAFANIEGLGSAYSKLLLERLLQPPEETDAFRGYESALRDYLGREAGAARMRLSDTATSGGWFDSGARATGMSDISRGQLESYAGGIRDILLGLDARRTAEVLPYLSAASNESMATQGMNINASLQSRSLDQQNQAFWGDMLLGIGGMKADSLLPALLMG